MIEDNEIEENLVKKQKIEDQPKSVKWTKYALLAINGLTFSFGFILFVLGCFYYSAHETYEDDWEIGSNFCSASVFCIVVGIMTCMVSILGFYGALRSNRCCLLSFCILLGICVFLEMILAVTFFTVVINDNLTYIVAPTMKDTMKKYDQKHKDHGITKAWNLLQTELHCCGVKGADDWHEDASSIHRWSSSNALPDSCCSTIPYSFNETSSTCTLGSADHYKDGCLKKIKQSIKKYGGAIGGVIIFFSLVQIFLIVGASHLIKKVSTQPQTCFPFY